MDAEPTSRRLAKGTNFLDLVKWLRVHRRTAPITGLSPAASAFIDDRVLVTHWYDLRHLLELLDFTFAHVLGHSAEKAHEAGILGGTNQLKGPHKGFIVVGKPQESLMAMRHSWRAYFNFGELHTALEGRRRALFTVTGYPDVPCVHGMMIAGWDVAAARLAGATEARCEILERPWLGDKQLSFRIHT